MADLKKKRPRGLQLKHVYFASPKSPEAIRHHTAPTTNTDFYTANINGLLSKSKGNKCELLRKFISTGNTHKVIALTETWLTPDHFNAEFIKPFHNFACFVPTETQILTPTTMLSSTPGAELPSSSVQKSLPFLLCLSQTGTAKS